MGFGRSVSTAFAGPHFGASRRPPAPGESVALRAAAGCVGRFGAASHLPAVQRRCCCLPAARVKGAAQRSGATHPWCRVPGQPAACANWKALSSASHHPPHSLLASFPSSNRTAAQLRSSPAHPPVCQQPMELWLAAVCLVFLGVASSRGSLCRSPGTEVTEKPAVRGEPGLLAQQELGQAVGACGCCRSKKVGGWRCWER